MSRSPARLPAWLPAAFLACLVLAAGAAHAQSAVRSGFDHATTGWPLDGAHRNVDCERCHVEGIFKGTSRECFLCHNRGGIVRAAAPPVNHIRSTNQCEDCHTQVSWANIRRVDHTQVLGSCASCHNGAIATGKPPNHPVTSGQCDLCHRTNSWSHRAFLQPDAPPALRVAAADGAAWSWGRAALGALREPGR
jgi:hypothetical protein